MRTGTKNFMTGISLGLIGISYAVGATNASQALSNQAAPAEASATPTASATPSATATATPTPTATKTAAKKKTKKTSTTTTKKTTTTSTKKKTTTTKKKSTSSSGSSSSGSSSSGSSSSSVTKTGSDIGYQFGDIQLKVTKANGKITDIVAVSFNYTRGPSNLEQTLIDSAIAANGSNFNSVSRATYTSYAFMDALDSALAKF